MTEDPTHMKVIALALAGAATMPAPAQAHDRADCRPGLERRYSHAYDAVAKRHGARAPGRNIRRDGVRFRGITFDATCGELRRSYRQLQSLLARPRYLAVSAVPPPQPPAGVGSVGVEPTGTAACIVERESTGNEAAVNGQYEGLAQWSREAWARMGGTQYAPTPLGASREQQLAVLNHGLSVYGCADWCPFDGC